MILTFFLHEDFKCKHESSLSTALTNKKYKNIKIQDITKSITRSTLLLGVDERRDSFHDSRTKIQKYSPSTKKRCPIYALIASCRDIMTIKRRFVTMKINLNKTMSLTHLAAMRKEPGASKY